MKLQIEGTSLDAEVDSRARRLFDQSRQELYKRTDHSFLYLMLLQWLGAVLAASLISPATWAGATSRPHLHLWIAIFLGGLIVAPAIGLAYYLPGRLITRHVLAVSQLTMGALLIHLSGGRIETHFHVFGSLAFLAFYRNWPVLITATLVIVIDHTVRGLFWPQSVYGVAFAPIWRTFEHAGWVVFEDVILIGFCVEGSRELFHAAQRQAQLEVTREGIEHTVTLRTAELSRSDKRRHAILESALDGIVSIDRQGCVLEFNPAAESIFGYRRATVLGRAVSELIIPPSMRAEYHAAIARHPTTGESRILNKRIELPAMRADGVEIPIEVALTAVKDTAGETTYTAFIRDIGERKRAEETLLKRTRDLEAAQGQLTAAAEFAASLNQTDVQATYDSALNCIARVLRSPLAIAFASDGSGTLKAKSAVAIDGRALAPRVSPATVCPRPSSPRGRFRRWKDRSKTLACGCGSASARRRSNGSSAGRSFLTTAASAR